MKIRARAKVNLALDVIRTMENGYHELDMIMAPVSLYNELEIDIASQDQVTCDLIELPEYSTLHRTLKLLREKQMLKQAYRIHVRKHIPDQAGLAGSSADAAALLKALLQWEGISLPMSKQLEMAACIGADVPFCLVSQTARVQGIGERIRCLDTDWQFPCVLVKPSYGVSTPEAFALWEKSEIVHVDVDRIESCIKKKDYASLMQAMGNALEMPAFSIRPALKNLKEEMEKQGLDRVMMTGSGSALMGFSQDVQLLKTIEEKYRKQGYFSQIVTIGQEEEWQIQ